MRDFRPVALLLDFDGVIVDSVKIKIDAYLEIYADEAPEVREAIHAHQRTNGGLTRRLKFRYFETEVFGRSVTDDDIERLSAEYTRLVHDKVLACPLVPGARELLDQVRGRAAMHVVSGTPHEELEDIVRRRGLAQYFATVHGAPTTKLAAFRGILANGGYRPQQALAIGDATTEMHAAAVLGVPFLGVCPRGESPPFPPSTPVVPTLVGVAAALGFK